MNEQENLNNKIITISFMIAAALLGVVFYVMAESAAAISTGSFGRVVSQEWFRHGIPVGIAIVIFFALQFNKKILAWAEEVVVELRRIVWPSRRDTTVLTVQVCVMLIVAGIVLGSYDLISGQLIDWLLHHNFMGLFT